MEKNHHYFSDLGITVVLPRIKNPDNTHISDEHFLSYSLTEFDSIFLKKSFKIPKGEVVYALIDVANGHMVDLINSCRAAKSKHQNRLVLMVGNVANPDTFYHYCIAGGGLCKDWYRKWRGMSDNRTNRCWIPDGIFNLRV